MPNTEKAKYCYFPKILIYLKKLKYKPGTFVEKYLYITNRFSFKGKYFGKFYCFKTNLQLLRG